MKKLLYKLILIGDYTLKWDGNLFERMYKAFTTDITNSLLILVPVIGIISAIISGIVFLLRDEDEREQKPIKKPLKTILIAVIVIESIATIFKLFGL